MYQSAHLAIENLKGLFPNRKIICIDSLCASTGLGFLTYHAALKQAEGMSIEALSEWVESNKLKVCHWFTVEDLDNLYRGGRLSKSAAIAGNMLKIKPVLIVDETGNLKVVEKIRGTKNAYKSMINHLLNSGINLEDQTIFIGHGDDIESAHNLSEMIKTQIQVKDVKIMPIGPVIGTHTGPGMLSLFFFGSTR